MSIFSKKYKAQLVLDLQSITLSPNSAYGDPGNYQGMNYDFYHDIADAYVINVAANGEILIAYKQNSQYYDNIVRRAYCALCTQVQRSNKADLVNRLLIAEGKAARQQKSGSLLTKLKSVFGKADKLSVPDYGSNSLIVSLDDPMIANMITPPSIFVKPFNEYWVPMVQKDFKFMLHGTAKVDNSQKLYVGLIDGKTTKLIFSGFSMDGHTKIVHHIFDATPVLSDDAFVNELYNENDIQDLWKNISKGLENQRLTFYLPITISEKSEYSEKREIHCNLKIVYRLNNINFIDVNAINYKNPTLLDEYINNNRALIAAKVAGETTIPNMFTVSQNARSILTNQLVQDFTAEHPEFSIGDVFNLVFHITGNEIVDGKENVNAYKFKLYNPNDADGFSILYDDISNKLVLKQNVPAGVDSPKMRMYTRGKSLYKRLQKLDENRVVAPEQPLYSGAAVPEETQPERKPGGNYSMFFDIIRNRLMEREVGNGEPAVSETVEAPSTAEVAAKQVSKKKQTPPVKPVPANEQNTTTESAADLLSPVAVHDKQSEEAISTISEQLIEPIVIKPEVKVEKTKAKGKKKKHQKQADNKSVKHADSPKPTDQGLIVETPIYVKAPKKSKEIRLEDVLVTAHGTLIDLDAEDDKKA